MATVARALTYEDLCRAREDGNRYELIEGELVLVGAPSLWHQRLLLRLAFTCTESVTQRGLGEVLVAPLDVRFADGSIFQPDVVVVLSDRSSVLEEALIEGAPSLVVEIVSPSSRAKDRGAKLRTYARHGVPEYWAVDADARAITRHSDPIGDAYGDVMTETTVVRAATVPGLAVDLAALFAGLSARH